MTFFILYFQGDLKIKLNSPKNVNIGEQIPAELVIENLSDQVAEASIKVLSNEKYSLPATRTSFKLTLQAKQKRNFPLSIKPIVTGTVQLMMLINDQPHHHDVEVNVPGYHQSHHTSLTLDLTHHNRYSQHHLLVNNRTNNRVRISVTGDIVGPLLLDELKPTVRKF